MCCILIGFLLLRSNCSELELYSKETVALVSGMLELDPGARTAVEHCRDKSKRLADRFAFRRSSGAVTLGAHGLCVLLVCLLCPVLQHPMAKRPKRSKRPSR